MNSQEFSEQQPYRVVKIVSPSSMMYRVLREEENKRIARRNKHTGGSNYMKDLLVIRDKKGVVIKETSIFDTLCVLGRSVGFEKLASTGVEAKSRSSKLSLFAQETTKPQYKLTASGWYVLSNVPVCEVALALNQAFDILELNYIASVVDR